MIVWPRHHKNSFWDWYFTVHLQSVSEWMSKCICAARFASAFARLNVHRYIKLHIRICWYTRAPELPFTTGNQYMTPCILSIDPYYMAFDFSYHHWRIWSIHTFVITNFNIAMEVENIEHQFYPMVFTIIHISNGKQKKSHPKTIMRVLLLLLFKF